MVSYNLSILGLLIVIVQYDCLSALREFFQIAFWRANIDGQRQYTNYNDCQNFPTNKDFKIMISQNLNNRFVKMNSPDAVKPIITIVPFDSLYDNVGLHDQNCFIFCITLHIS